MKMKVLNRVKALMKRRTSKILLALVVCTAGVLLLNSMLKSDSESSPETQVAIVQTGDLTVDISAAGNLSLSRRDEALSRWREQ
jgi:hypothetical protein